MFCIFFMLASLFIACTPPTERIDCDELTCDPTTRKCVLCKEDGDCWERSYKCDSSGHCIVRGVGDPFDPMLILAIVMVFVISAIGAIGGLGGGGMMVPLLFFILDLPLEESVALAQASTSGQAIANFVRNIQLVHPMFQVDSATIHQSIHPLDSAQHHGVSIHIQPRRGVINFSLLSLWLPIALLGVIAGSLANAVSPDWFRISLLFILISTLLCRNIVFVLKQRKADKIAKLKARQQDTVEDKLSQQTPQDPTNDNDSKEIVSLPDVSLLPDKTTMSIPPSLAQLILSQHSIRRACMFARFPIIAISIILLCFVLSVILEIPRLPSLSHCGSTLYWIFTTSLMLSQLLLFGMLLFFYQRRLRQYHRQPFTQLTSLQPLPPDLLQQIDWHADDYSPSLLRTLFTDPLPIFLSREWWFSFTWSSRSTLIYPLVSVVAGAGASLLGIGGGMVVGQLFLEVGLTPQEVSATCGAFTLVVALNSSIIKILEGIMPWQQGAIMFVVGAVSVIPTTYIKLFIQQKHWLFIIPLSMGFIMLGSLVSLLASGIYSIYEIIVWDGSLMFGSLC